MDKYVVVADVTVKGKTTEVVVAGGKGVDKEKAKELLKILRAVEKKNLKGLRISLVGGKPAKKEEKKVVKESMFHEATSYYLGEMDGCGDDVVVLEGADYAAASMFLEDWSDNPFDDDETPTVVVTGDDDDEDKDKDDSEDDDKKDDKEDGKEDDGSNTIDIDDLEKLLKDNDIELKIEVPNYELKHQGKPVFSGDNFNTSPITDPKQAKKDLLGLLTLDKNDAEDDYFSNYGDDQWAFAQSPAADAVRTFLVKCENDN